MIDEMRDGCSHPDPMESALIAQLEQCLAQWQRLPPKALAVYRAKFFALMADTEPAARRVFAESKNLPSEWRAGLEAML